MQNVNTWREKKSTYGQISNFVNCVGQRSLLITNLKQLLHTGNPEIYAKLTMLKLTQHQMVLQGCKLKDATAVM